MITFSTQTLSEGNHSEEIITVAEFGYFILIRIDFYDFVFSVFSLVLVSIEKNSQQLETVIPHIAKNLQVLQLYYAWKYGKTQICMPNVLILWLSWKHDKYKAGLKVRIRLKNKHAHANQD